VSLALGARGSTHMQSYEAIDIDRFLSIVAG
jgi:hypothetical protein